MDNIYNEYIANYDNINHYTKKSFDGNGHDIIRPILWDMILEKAVSVLHSKNLVNWEIINYVYDRFPLPKYDVVNPGHGAWAPAIRYHNDTFYVMIPTPDEGLFVSETKDPYGKWSEPRLLVSGAGLEDPCPIWVDDKCYVVHGYVKSRCGFNSMLGLIECDTNLTKVITPSVVIYDGHNDNPTIEGPKFNY